MKSISSFFLTIAFFSFLTSPLMARSKNVDLNQSIFKWHGSKIGGGHDGTIKLSKGQVVFKNDEMTSGNFVMDMKSINTTDLSGALKKKLDDHLKSDDFFDVNKYPTAKLTIQSGKEGMIKGKLTIKDQTHPIRFSYKVNGNHYKGVMVFDRSKFNVRYGSKSFFKSLGDKVIHDEVKIEFDVLIRK